ncbi:MAG TPA: 3' terminal RNA ribose 2'-O-methyltransferase Hen1 [Ktedonobacterales bacterium]
MCEGIRMLLTLTCYASNAPDLGYLLGKNPASVFERPFSAGRVWVFYPDVADDHMTIAMLTEVDPIGLVRGPTPLTQLGHYINDRPYVASSITSVALSTAFSSALAGKATSHTERLTERMRWEVNIAAVACEASEDFITRMFAPLGYAVTTTRLPLNQRFPAWGQANLYSLSLAGSQTVRDVLSHLYVLLPVLDNSKHYYVGADEADKLLAHGGHWLNAHPEREVIAKRYLRYKRPLVQSALDRLAESDPALRDAEAQDTPTEVAGEVAAGETIAEPVESIDVTPGLHEQRLNAVMAAIRDIGAHTLVDLGCGEGRLLTLALAERSLTRILGMDVSPVALARAARRLHLESLAPMQRARIQLTQGSALYRDDRLHGFDVAALVEVIEHLDMSRLSAMERVVFQHARPRRVIVTTPNLEYNVRWESLGSEQMRHRDHRFEWSRAECQAWADRVATTYGYRTMWQGIGPDDPDVGAPSQMVIFDREDGAGSEGRKEVVK